MRSAAVWRQRLDVTRNTVILGPYQIGHPLCPAAYKRHSIASSEKHS